MTIKATLMEALLDHYAAAGAEVLLRFKNDFTMQGGPSGPGRLKRVVLPPPVPNGTGTPLDGLYEFTMPITLGDPQTRQQKQAHMPTIFHAEDVLWISTGVIVKEEPLVRPIGGNGGSLHIPGS